MTFCDGVIAATILTALVALPLAAAQAGPPAGKPATVAPAAAATASPAPAPAATPALGAEAARLLKEMSDYVGSAKEFTFRAEIAFDRVLASGQKVQYSVREDVAFERPGHLAIDYSGELGDRRFWYDGRTVTLYDPGTPFYATEPAPPDIDAALQKISTELNFLPPLSDLFYRDPYRVLRDNVRSGFVVGANRVTGRLCRHLAFVDSQVDWQVWIAAGAQPTPCKVAIDYRSLPGRRSSAPYSPTGILPRGSPRRCSPPTSRRTRRGSRSSTSRWPAGASNRRRTQMIRQSVAGGRLALALATGVVLAAGLAVSAERAEAFRG